MARVIAMQYGQGSGKRFPFSTKPTKPMKPRFNITASILVIFLTHAPAATFSWDTLAGDSALTGGSGTWDTTTALWSEDNGITSVP